MISFQSFLRALAARTGQLLNLTDVARDLGIAVNTAKAWLSVLEATFQIILLRPYHANVGKRSGQNSKGVLHGHRNALLSGWFEGPGSRGSGAAGRPILKPPFFSKS